MTSPTLSVLPAAPAAPSAPVSSTSGPAAAQAPKDEGFAQHLQTQQQQVQNKGAQKPQAAKPDGAKTQAPADSPTLAESATELTEPVDLDAVTKDPALLIATETDLDEALDAQADSGLPAMALSILSQVQAIKNSKVDPNVVQADSKLTRAPASTRQNLVTELSSASRLPQAGPLKAAEATAELDLNAELALPKAAEISNPLTAAPARKPALTAALALNSQSMQNAASQAASSQTRLLDEATASLAAFGRQMADDARAGVTQNVPPLDASLLTQLTATPVAMQVSSPAALPSPLALAVATPVHSPEWGAAMGRQMITLAQQAQGGMQSADIRLDPPELGPLRITLQMQDGMAHAMITSPHAQVRHALEQSLQQLQQQFAENGLTLGQADVGDQNASHHDFHEQLAAKNNKGDQPAFSLNGLATSDEASLLTGSTATRSLDPNALVDTFA